MTMNIRVARDSIVDHLIEGGAFGPEHYWTLIAEHTPEEQGLKAVKFVGLAARLSLWNEAEVLASDPIIRETPFGPDKNGPMAWLGIKAVGLGQIEVAKDFFTRVESPTYDMDLHILRGLIEAGRLEEAEAMIRNRTNFETLDNSGYQRALRGLVRKTCATDGGPKRALELVQELVPNPETSGIEDKDMERMRWDNYIDFIPAEALKRGDVKTATVAIALAYNLYPKPAAMGGGGIEDEAYDTQDEKIIEETQHLVREEEQRRNNLPRA